MRAHSLYDPISVATQITNPCLQDGRLRLAASSMPAVLVTGPTATQNPPFLTQRWSRPTPVLIWTYVLVCQQVCWIMSMGEMLLLLVPLFLDRDKWHMSVAPFGVHIFVTGQLQLVVKVFATLVYQDCRQLQLRKQRVVQFIYQKTIMSYVKQTVNLPNALDRQFQ